MKKLAFLTTLVIFAGCPWALCQDWHFYSTANSGITGNQVSAVAADNSGTVFIGTEASGLSVARFPDWATYTAANSSLLSDRIKALACDSSGRAWVGTDIGLSLFDGGSWQSFTTANSGLSDNWVVSVAVGSQDVAWFGTHGGGVCSYDGSWEVFKTSNSGLGSDRITVLAVDPDNRLWVGTKDAGVSVLSEGKWTVFDTSNSPLMSDYINCIGPCQSGAVWVGTPNGLCVYRDGGWEDLTSLVSDGDVRAAVVDDFGYRWFGQRTGIVRFDGRAATDCGHDVSNAWITSSAHGGGHVFFGTREHGLLEFRYGQNLPPQMPQPPSGPKTGATGIELEFGTGTSDPEGDNLYYQFDWGDGSSSSWGQPAQSHVFTALGTYKIISRGKDETGNVSGFSEAHTIAIASGNRPPQRPSTPKGPGSAYVGQKVEFATSSYDPDGDDIEFMFDWGDGNVGQWDGPTQSFVYESAGSYSVRAKARDQYGKESEWSDGRSVRVEERNRPPYQPTVPAGPSWGLVNNEYTFTTSAEDPEGDEVEYLLDWGDGTDSGWGPAWATHAFRRTGTYGVCALARDVYGAVSIWSDYHTIQIGGTPKPIIELDASRSKYSLGQTIKLYATLINDLEAMDVDVYVAVMLPGSEVLLFYPTFQPEPFPVSLTLAAQSHFGPCLFFEYFIEAHIPVGLYTWFGAIAKRGGELELLSEIDVLLFEYSTSRGK